MTGTCWGILYFFAVFLVDLSGVDAQSDEVSDFFGKTTIPLDREAQSALEADWKVLLVGRARPRLEARLKLTSSRAAPRLMQELGADSEEARRQAALTLSRSEGDNVAEALRTAFNSKGARKDEAFLRTLALALAVRGERAALPDIIRAITKVKRPRTRRLLILAAARLGGGDASTRLAMLWDRERNVNFRATVLLALGRLPEPGQHAVFHRSRTAKKDRLRRAAALAPLPIEKKSKVLRRFLFDDDAQVLEATLLNLAMNEDAVAGRATLVKTRHLNHDDPGVRRAALHVLDRDPRPETEKRLLNRWAKERDPLVRSTLLFCLRRAESDKARAVIAKVRSDPSRRIRRAAFLLRGSKITKKELLSILEGAHHRDLSDLALARLILIDPAAALEIAKTFDPGDARKHPAMDELAAHLRSLNSDPEDLERRAQVTLGLAADDLGWSPSWLLNLATHRLFREIEGLNRDFQDGRQIIRVGPDGQLRAQPRLNREEEDLRLWFDRFPLFDERREAAELGPR